MASKRRHPMTNKWETNDKNCNPMANGKQMANMVIVTAESKTESKGASKQRQNSMRLTLDFCKSSALEDKGKGSKSSKVSQKMGTRQEVAKIATCRI